MPSPKGETVAYTVIIHLTTDNGECPTKDEMSQLVLDQMNGELDETTGLACMAATCIIATGNLEPRR